MQQELATVEETELFLGAYGDARAGKLSDEETERSWAAGLWTRLYDAKFQHASGQPVTSMSEEEASERLRRRGSGREQLKSRDS